MKQYTINMTLRMYTINPDEPLTTVRVVEWAALGTQDKVGWRQDTPEEKNYLEN